VALNAPISREAPSCTIPHGGDGHKGFALLRAGSYPVSRSLQAGRGEFNGLDYPSPVSAMSPLNLRFIANEPASSSKPTPSLEKTAANTPRSTRSSGAPAAISPPLDNSQNAVGGGHREVKIVRRKQDGAAVPMRQVPQDSHVFNPVSLCQRYLDFMRQKRQFERDYEAVFLPRRLALPNSVFTAADYTMIPAMAYQEEPVGKVLTRAWQPLLELVVLWSALSGVVMLAGVCPPLGWDLLGLHCLAAGDGIRTGTTSRSTAQDEHQRTAGTKKEDLHQGWPKARFTSQFRHQIR
jgi:hypothetical protein